MKNEIKVNEYIRMKDGFIDKIVDIRDTYSERKLIAFEKSNSLKSDIGLKAMVVKHSPNLIDLIQCGDYVNGEQVCKSRYDELYTSYVYCGGIGVRTIEAYPTFIKDMKEEDIETIVTKEMMESISYKVKQEEN